MLYIIKIIFNNHICQIIILSLFSIYPNISLMTEYGSVIHITRYISLCLNVCLPALFSISAFHYSVKVLPQRSCLHGVNVNVYD